MTVDSSLASFRAQLAGAHQLLVGFSGGLDSTVLLYGLRRLLPPGRLTAIHINHGLSANADRWQAHCAAVCQSLGVPLIVEQVVVSTVGKGIEEAARDCRYAMYSRHLKKNGLLLLGHHRDDQVETVLFRALRGSGPKGLAGMPVERRLAAGALLRPLLSIARADLEVWARKQGLSWVDDESNAGVDFDRNFIRCQIVPQLAERWPDYQRRLLRTAEHSAESAELLAELGSDDLQRLGERCERLGWSIPVAGLVALSSARQRNLLRSWLSSRGLALPGHRPLAAVQSDVLTARQDASPRVAFGSGQFRRFNDRLYLLPVAELAPPTATLDWQPATVLTFDDGARLSASLGEEQAPQRLSVPAAARFDIRFREGGERCHPAGRAGSRAVKKLLQEYGLEPWLRDRVPLIYRHGQLAAVGDLWVCTGFEAAPGALGATLSWGWA